MLSIIYNPLSKVPILDFLWDCALSASTPISYLEELGGIDKGGKAVGVKNLGVMVRVRPSGVRNIAAGIC
jgi:hypothetical protein